MRAYSVDARGYRWRRSAEDAVLVGMVVQRARGGGVVVRLCLRPAVTGAAPAAAAAADPLQQSCKRLQARMRQCDCELGGLGRFKPSEVGGQRWRHEASRWAVLAHRAAAIGAEPGAAAALGAQAEAATELFLLLTLTLTLTLTPTLTPTLTLTRPRPRPSSSFCFSMRCSRAPSPARSPLTSSRSPPRAGGKASGRAGLSRRRARRRRARRLPRRLVPGWQLAHLARAGGWSRAWWSAQGRWVAPWRRRALWRTRLVPGRGQAPGRERCIMTCIAWRRRDMGEI